MKRHIAITKEIQDIIVSIPKDYRKQIDKIIEFYYEQGVSDVQSLIQGIVEIPATKVNEYGVWHESDIDGG